MASRGPADATASVVAQRPPDRCAVVPRAALAWPADPLGRVLRIGGDHAIRVLVVAFVLTLAGHGAAAVRTAYIHAELIAWTLRLDTVIDQHLSQEVDIETIRSPEKPPPPPQKEEEPPPVDKKVVFKEPEPAPAAQAAQIVAAKPDNEVLNFGDNVFVVGNSQRYAGGPTMANGTGDKPPSGPHVAPAGTGNGTGPQAMTTDLSRTAELAGSGEWRCPFPPEADVDQIDEAAAVIEVMVGAGGQPTGATVLQDPGHGFGREARACALRESYVPALDRAGRPVASSKKFRVKFER